MRTARWVVGIGCLIAIAAVPLAGAQSTGYHSWYVPWKMDGPFQFANLTWKSGTGGITWGSETHEDNQPADPYTKEEYDQHQQMRDLGLEAGGPARTFDFTSAPTADMMVLNGTRTVQLNLLLQKYDGATCPASDVDPQVEVRLLIGDRILAGANGMSGLNQNIYWFYLTSTHVAPPAPEGYFRCFYSMGVEQTVIPAGTVMKLKITFLHQNGPVTFGLAGEHRSFLTFPLLPPEEIIFRFPELVAPADEETPDEGSDGGPEAASAVRVEAPARVPSGALAGLGLVVAATLARRGRKPTLLAVALLLAAATLSGCLAGGNGKGGDEVLKGGISNTLIKDQGGLTDGELGSILGQVHDDLHIPIKGVHVSIIGLSNFTQTDGKGRFTFLNLLPGTFKLRFDKADYVSFEGDVEVKAGFVSRPNILMVLVNPKERDARPHSHDYWDNGITSRLLMDARVPKACPETTCAVQYDFEIPSKDDAFTSVLPGTTEVEITLDWVPSALGQTEIGLAVQHNGDKWLIQNSTVYAPRPPKVPFRVQVAWEMTDPGHQPISSWRFHWFEGDSPYEYTGTKCYVAACTNVGLNTLPKPPATSDPGERWMQAKVSIKRGGSLPLEPGHPDRWAAGAPLTLMKAYNMQPSMGGNLPPSSPSCAAYAGYCFVQYWPKHTPVAGFLVPDGTQWIEVTIKQNRITDPDWGVVLWYKPADLTDNKGTYDITGWKSVTAQSGGTWEKRVFKVPVKEGEADFVYAKKTSWKFSLRPDASDEDVWHDHTLAGGRTCVGVCQPPLYDSTKWLRYTVDAGSYNTPP